MNTDEDRSPVDVLRHEIGSRLCRVQNRGASRSTSGILRRVGDVPTAPLDAPDEGCEVLSSAGDGVQVSTTSSQKASVFSATVVRASNLALGVLSNIFVLKYMDRKTNDDCRTGDSIRKLASVLLIRHEPTEVGKTRRGSSVHRATHFLVEAATRQAIRDRTACAAVLSKRKSKRNYRLSFTFHC